MEQSNKIKEYLKTVCEQIRWKKAHKIISEEIENHIIDQKNALISEGLDEETAINKAILEMGDPTAVGLEFDRTYIPKPEWGIIALTGILLILGVIIRGFIFRNPEMTDISNNGIMFTNSIIFTIFGMLTMIIAYFLDYTIIGKYPKIIYFSLVLVTLGVMIISPVYQGQIFYVKFLMLLFPTAFAGIVYDMRNKGYLGIILSGIYFIIPVLICLKIPSLSILALYSITSLMIFTYAILRGWFNVKKLNGLLLIYIPIVIVSLTKIVFINDYQLLRLKTAFNPSLDPMGAGYWANATRSIIVNAKLFGSSQFGLNADNVLVDIHTDFLLTYLIHRIGWISFIIIMFFILAFIIRSLKFSLKQKSVLGGLVSLSVIVTFIMQVLFYVASNLGFQLFTPLTLPLISYSKIATVINMFLIGIMLSVYKSSMLYGNRDLNPLIRRERVKIVDGKIIIDLNR
ncbi:FtsW/RodA/SpoVE family cell cycle protein [Tissierella sp. MSJ-40]|uniref:FtsW/RodA/SpoVE family cell cycle protein n=1 Tax=Tissierella simiarum TaxID=2841534 RepID=A0ABS6E1G6_9FIRM|nr:FtsW/RodA/SpoVE family cell cycle protein [Tissierella simiarum]MBU5436632.1 FtsW/RodA/SpoVE family cell cycle protein [Tissierella simiarum]